MGYQMTVGEHCEYKRKRKLFPSLDEIICQTYQITQSSLHGIKRSFSLSQLAILAVIMRPEHVFFLMNHSGSICNASTP